MLCAKVLGGGRRPSLCVAEEESRGPVLPVCRPVRYWWLNEYFGRLSAVVMLPAAALKVAGSTPARAQEEYEEEMRQLSAGRAVAVAERVAAGVVL